MLSTSLYKRSKEECGTNSGEPFAPEDTMYEDYIEILTNKTTLAEMRSMFHSLPQLRVAKVLGKKTLFLRSLEVIKAIVETFGYV